MVEDIKMDLWKERIWTLIQSAGLLEEIAWRDDLEADRLAEEEAEEDIYELDLDELEAEIYNS